MGSEPENTKLPVDLKAGLAFVWLIWALKDRRCDLVAIATTVAARDRYSRGWRKANPGARINVEKAYVDHLYGEQALLAAFNRATIKEPTNAG